MNKKKMKQKFKCHYTKQQQNAQKHAIRHQLKQNFTVFGRFKIKLKSKTNDTELIIFTARID